MGKTHELMVHEHMSPLKIFEALASGRPLIVSDLPVLREVVEPEYNGVVVPPGDVAALRQGIDRLLNDRALGDRLVKGAQATLIDHTWDRRASAILDC
jgi:glycosyltransferase involved in cell wall biosynthesis